VATLAYDCRRPQFFRTQLIDALHIVQRGDLRASEMIGDWAGELGPLQFTPSDYYKYAVDFDGDGRRDLIHSVPDLLASGANFLVGLGWKRGEPWLQEVRAGTNVPWEQADLSVKHPRSQWAHWGATYPDGRPLPADDLPASLLLPMGRLGPAFLAIRLRRRIWRRALPALRRSIAALPTSRCSARPRSWICSNCLCATASRPQSRTASSD
jgi:membrane-bound lytic murein transglycosylase B